MDTIDHLWRFENEAREAGYNYIVGIDESGRGPLAGPVVAAAVIIPQDFDLTGIRDSKMLTPAQRESAYQRLVSSSAAYGIGIIDSKRIDRINILQATYEAMRAALSDLGAAFDLVLVDGNRSIPGLTINQITIIDGDKKSASIAAASIVAKVTRDSIMVELAGKYPGYGFEKHKGYCTGEHLRAIEEQGICNIHRRSFSPIARQVNDDCLQKSLF